MRYLVLSLPHLNVRLEYHLDYQSAEPVLLYQIGAGELAADCIEALGWLLAEMGDLAATAHSLSAGCQRYVSDYAPRTPKHIPTARP